MSINGVTNGGFSLFNRFFRCQIRHHRVDSHWICKLIAKIPGVKFLVVVVVTNRGCSVEGICEGEFFVEKFASVQIESEANFCFWKRRRINCVKHAANNKHVANLKGNFRISSDTFQNQSSYLMMVNADIQAVDDL